jgi:hypothetical protein
LTLRTYQHVPPRDLNTGRAVGLLCRSADLDVSPQAFLARVKRRQPGERVATLAIFTEGQTALALWRCMQGGAGQSVRRSCSRGRRCDGASGRAPFVPMVETTDLRDRHDGAETQAA